MKTWSIAGALDGLRKLEKLTRPPKLGHDVDVPVAAADALVDREAEEEVGIGTGLDGIDENLTKFIKQTIGPTTCCGELFVHAADCTGYDDPGTGCIDDGAPQQVTLSGREYERYLDGALNEQPATCSQCNGTRRCGPYGAVCPACLVSDVYADYVTARMLDDDGAPIRLPDSTLDDVVAQLAQLTYFAEDIRNHLANLSPAAFTPGAGDTAADSVAPPAESAAIPTHPPCGRDCERRGWHTTLDGMHFVNHHVAPVPPSEPGGPVTFKDTASPAEVVSESPHPSTASAGHFNDMAQKSEHCWCGEGISAEGSEEAVLMACKNFRAWHVHRNPNQ